jgi:hypothetical protein
MGTRLASAMGSSGRAEAGDHAKAPGDERC